VLADLVARYALPEFLPVASLPGTVLGSCAFALTALDSRLYIRADRQPHHQNEFRLVDIPTMLPDGTLAVVRRLDSGQLQCVAAEWNNAALRAGNHPRRLWTHQARDLGTCVPFRASGGRMLIGVEINTRNTNHREFRMLDVETGETVAGYRMEWHNPFYLDALDERTPVHVRRTLRGIDAEGGMYRYEVRCRPHAAWTMPHVDAVHRFAVFKGMLACLCSRGDSADVCLYCVQTGQVRRRIAVPVDRYYGYPHMTVDPISGTLVVYTTAPRYAAWVLAEDA
jgi:hypothetical protein